MSNTFTSRAEDDPCCNIDIILTSRRKGLGGITCYRDYMTIDFMDGSWLDIAYPKDLDDLPSVIESELLRWTGQEGEYLTAPRIHDIVGYTEEIKEAILKLNKKNGDVISSE